MAVPKKRTSKTKKTIRKWVWKKKAMDRGEKAYSLAILTIRREETRKGAKGTTDEGEKKG
jgi:hypothetical protein|uniref:Large ribosomal subunit protein bL32c n=1 Tax=Elliptochloris antarctica TaxID=1844074 RepID=A0A0C5BLW9_ELLAN|nr:ribosomal protein L32 [Hemichloris antarctica]